MTQGGSGVVDKEGKNVVRVRVNTSRYSTWYLVSCSGLDKVHF